MTTKPLQTGPQMLPWAQTLASGMPNAEVRELTGDWHGILAPVQLDAISHSRQRWNS